MKKKALITVISTASSDKSDLIEIVTPGDFYITENGFRVEYDETKISGMEGTRTSLVIREKEFDLIREGTTETKMEFKINENTVSLYKTPYGILEFNINTRKLDINMNKDGGKISTTYALSIEGQPPMKTELTVDVKL